MDKRNQIRTSSEFSMSYALWLIVSLVLAIGPFLAPALIPTIKIGGLAQLIFVVIGTMSLVVMAILFVITKLYMKVGANEALVRTGMGGRKVVLDNGIIIVPFMHRWGCR